ncbi:GntR family transcriptional regulator [Mycobacterium sp. URHB0021]
MEGTTGVDVYQQLREAIVDGTLDADTPLTELALAAKYNVSRTPVREALRRLEQDGLVERGARGMQVRGRSPEEILELYEVRITLEGAAARAAADRRTDLDLLKLERVHSSMMEISTDDPERLATANRKFHEAIWATSHNSTLVDLLGRLHAHLIRYRETTLTYHDRWASVLDEHRQLIEAIKAGDRERAGRIAEEHMTGARNVRLQMYAEADAATH